MFGVLVLCFVSGIVLLQLQSELPPNALLIGLAVSIAGALVCRRVACTAVAAFAAGFLYAALRAHLAGAGLPWPAGIEGADLDVEGVVVSLPETDPGRVRFDFEIQRVAGPPAEAGFGGRIRLGWYETSAEPLVGEHWRLRVRLKRPRGFMNPGGFDYEGWLFRQGIRATGYVRPCACNARLAGPDAVFAPDIWRQRIRDGLTGRFTDTSALGLVSALSIGDRSRIPARLWRALRRTGTSHLVAISGLHIGLIAGLAFAVGQGIWRRLGSLPLRLPAPFAGALAGMVCALLYAALAGFSVPTQRASVMVAVGLGALLLRRRTRPFRVLMVALLGVVLVDPFSVLSAGLWLSFGAVGLLIYTLGSRVGEGPAWHRWGRAQLYIAVGLAPLAVGWFQQASLISPAVNLVAVPWFTLMLVPLALCCALCVLAGAGALLTPLLALTELLARVTINGLDWASSTPLAAVQAGAVPLWTLVSAGLGALVLLIPAGIPGRWLGIVFFLPLLGVRPPQLPFGAYELTLLDVGQGLAAVMRTRGHTLVYDTGPAFSETFDAGAAALVPYLREVGVRHVDLLVLSHGANDHAGGARSLREALPVYRALSGEPAAVASVAAAPCLAGQAWRWDGVTFEMLSPPDGSHWRDNNASCVLRIGNDTAAALLTGDIEKEAERSLIARASAKLDVDLVQVPHHGSHTSSTPGFIEHTRPTYALVSAGYHNRFGFPRPDVAERWRAAGAALLNTVDSGAIRVLVPAGGGALSVDRYRASARRYWRQKD